MEMLKCKRSFWFFRYAKKWFGVHK